jgi:hypothetical protein
VTKAEREAVNNSIAAYTANTAASVLGAPFVQKLGGTWLAKFAGALSLTHSDRMLVHVAGREIDSR